MQVKCTNETLTETQKSALSKILPPYYLESHFGILKGQEYTVLGITFSASLNITLYQVYTGSYITHPPAVLFEITDPRVSQHWEAKSSSDGDLTLWPSVFYRDYFHDELSEGNHEMVEEFHKLHRLLKEEFNDSNSE